MTLDFLGKGGSGYLPFTSFTKPADFDRGVMRELLRREMHERVSANKRVVWDKTLDFRWRNLITNGDPGGASTNLKYLELPVYESYSSFDPQI
jgi:hypothetical protein